LLALKQLLIWLQHFAPQTSTTVYNPSTGANDVTSIGNPTLFYTGAIIYILSFVPFLVAWIGALVNLARLQRWGWFVFMLVFNVISLIVYLFAGPETPMRIKKRWVFSSSSA
jgi:hypothetical protein